MKKTILTVLALSMIPALSVFSDPAQTGPASETTPAGIKWSTSTTLGVGGTCPTMIANANMSTIHLVYNGSLTSSLTPDADAVVNEADQNIRASYSPLSYMIIDDNQIGVPYQIDQGFFTKTDPGNNNTVTCVTGELPSPYLSLSLDNNSIVVSRNMKIVDNYLTLVDSDYLSQQMLRSLVFNENYSTPTYRNRIDIFTPIEGWGSDQSWYSNYQINPCTSSCLINDPNNPNARLIFNLCSTNDNDGLYTCSDTSSLGSLSQDYQASQYINISGAPSNLFVSPLFSSSTGSTENGTNQYRCFTVWEDTATSGNIYPFVSTLTITDGQWDLTNNPPVFSKLPALKDNDGNQISVDGRISYAISGLISNPLQDPAHPQCYIGIIAYKKSGDDTNLYCKPFIYNDQVATFNDYPEVTLPLDRINNSQVTYAKNIKGLISQDGTGAVFFFRANGLLHGVNGYYVYSLTANVIAQNKSLSIDFGNDQIPQITGLRDDNVTTDWTSSLQLEGCMTYDYDAVLSADGKTVGFVGAYYDFDFKTSCDNEGHPAPFYVLKYQYGTVTPPSNSSVTPSPNSSINPPVNP